jgi:hypothetical protein
LLNDGRVLITGGQSQGLYIATAELYDPATGVFTATGDMTTARGGHTATLLSDGQVLIAGGFGNGFGNAYLNSAELYDPATGTFKATFTITIVNNQPVPVVTNMATGRATFGASSIGTTLLPDDRILIAGGLGTDGFGNPVFLNSAELYDPNTGKFNAAGHMLDDRRLHTITRLSNGKILITGGVGSTGTGTGSIFRNSAELYNPANGSFIATGTMHFIRSNHTATLLTDGNVLVTGGNTFDTAAATAEVYRPK